MVTDDTARLVCLRTCHYWEKNLGNVNEFDQIKSWYGRTGDEPQTRLIKTKNCSTKISFITKLDIYIWSCSVLAQLLTFMHILKENNFYYNIKTEIHRK